MESISIRTFKEWDTDQNSIIKFDELKEGTNQAFPGIPDVILQFLLNFFSDKHNGRLNEKEFINCYEYLSVAARDPVAMIFDLTQSAEDG